MPVIICSLKQIPNIEPKFQKWVMFEGVGKSIKEELIILNNGCVFRNDSIGLYFKRCLEKRRNKYYNKYGN